MEKIKGKKVDNLGDILIYQGKLLSEDGIDFIMHYIDNNENNYLLKWCEQGKLLSNDGVNFIMNDNENEDYYYIAFKVSITDFNSYFDKKVSLFELIKFQENVYFTNTDCSETILIKTNDIPYIYLPGKKSFFDADQYEQYALELKEKLKPFFHELSDDEVQQLITDKKTYQYVIDNFKHPDWCNYHEALEGKMGCWSLTEYKSRHKISIEYCKKCDSFKKPKQND